MASDQEFQEAAERVKTLSRSPSNDDLLKLYALYKQATSGDVSGKKPSRLKMRDRAKYDAWAGQKGKSSDSARADYVALVNRLMG